MKKKVIIAISGGVDSALLLFLAKKFAQTAMGVLVNADHTLSMEITRAHQYAEELQVELKEIKLTTRNIPELYRNQVDRCYFCKKGIIHALLELKTQMQFDLVSEGTNISDRGDYRPGLQALKESNISSPYLIAEISKSEIMTLSQHFAFPSQIFPSNSCLATRIPYDTLLTPELLSLVERSETAIHKMLKTELCAIRVRIHFLSKDEYLARIEGDQPLFDFVYKSTNRQILVQKLKEIGFSYISLDLVGYTIGSFQEMV